MKISDLTNAQKRGLEMVFKQTIKIFPFIESIEINYKYYQDTDKEIESLLWLKGGIKYLSLSEFSGYPIKEYYYNYHHTHKDATSSSLGVAFKYGDERDDIKLSHEIIRTDEKFNYFYGISKGINEELNRFYSYLPDESSIYIDTRITDTYILNHKISLNCSDYYCSD